MTHPTQIHLVTGGNRGLGLETCRRLAGPGACVLLGSRDPQKGRRAADTLNARTGGDAVRPVQLDVTKPADIEAAARLIEIEYGRLDSLVNNAAVYLDSGVSVFDVDEETVRLTMETNVYGPLFLCRRLLPLLRAAEQARIVNLTSGLGSISRMTGRTASYRISKAALNALTRILASELADTQIKVNAVDPGWVRTDMGGPSAPLSPEEAVDTVLWLATLDATGPTGGLFRDRRPVEW